MTFSRLVAFGAAAIVLAGAAAAAAAADERVPYTLDVEDAEAKVGEPTTVKAVLTAPEGMRFTSVYRHRVIELSAEEGDGGVEIGKPVVVGEVQDDGRLVFEVPVTPTMAGSHPINGVIRASFLVDRKTESKSIPLMATVVGTE